MNWGSMRLGHGNWKSLLILASLAIRQSRCVLPPYSCCECAMPLRRLGAYVYLEAQIRNLDTDKWSQWSGSLSVSVAKSAPTPGVWCPLRAIVISHPCFYYRILRPRMFAVRSGPGESDEEKVNDEG